MGIDRETQNTVEWVAWKKDAERLLPWDVEEYPLDPEEVDRT